MSRRPEILNLFLRLRLIFWKSFFHNSTPSVSCLTAATHSLHLCPSAVAILKEHQGSVQNVARAVLPPQAHNSARVPRLTYLCPGQAHLTLPSSRKCSCSHLCFLPIFSLSFSLYIKYQPQLPLPPSSHSIPHLPSTGPPNPLFSQSPFRRGKESTKHGISKLRQDQALTPCNKVGEGIPP